MAGPRDRQVDGLRGVNRRARRAGRGVLDRRRGHRARGDRLGVSAGGWGSGYATEIGRAGLDYAFSVLGVEEVVSFTEVHNARSRAVMERLGMRYVGQILRPGLIAGSADVHEAAPFALYQITRPAYDPS